MSKKTVAQMEIVLMDQIEKAKFKLNQLQQKHKLEIGALAYKHGLQLLNHEQLEIAFSKITGELHHGNS